MLLWGAAGACAQEAGNPAPILKISRELVAAGKQTAHADVALERAQVFRAAHWPTPYIALRQVTGPGEVLFLTGYDSLASWGQDRAALDQNAVLRARLAAVSDRQDETLAQHRMLSAEFSPDISYNAKYDWSRLRCLDMIQIQLRPGHGDEYLDNRKIVVETHKRANVDEHLIIYRVSSGAPSTTFLIMRPVESFAGFDLESLHGPRYMEILGQANRTRLHDLFAASVMSEEESFYCAEPSLSYVTERWAGENKTFWLPEN